MRVPLAQPDIGKKETEYVLDCLQSGRLSGGRWIQRFEEHFKRQTGRTYAVAVNSGTAALHLATSGLGLKAGDEVITSPFSFVASANCIWYTGATPRFVDVDPVSGNIDPDLIEDALTKRTRSILAVDVFGVPAQWHTLKELASRHRLLLIADSCESLGATLGGQPSGSWADAAAFGFYPNKQITTGEGGILVTDKAELYEYAVSVRNQGRSRVDQMDHARLGYNYRLTDMAAALGCAQMERLRDLLQRRREISCIYHRILAPFEDRVELPTADATTRSWFVYPIRIRQPLGAPARDRLIAELKKSGIGTASYFPSIHLQPLYRKRFGYKPGDYPISEDLSNRTLILPFHTRLTNDQLDYVAETLGRLLQRL